MAMNVTNATWKHVLLLHYVGEEVSDIFETLPNTGNNKKFKKDCEALTKYFTPTKMCHSKFEAGATRDCGEFSQTLANCR